MLFTKKKCKEKEIKSFKCAEEDFRQGRVHKSYFWDSLHLKIQGIKGLKSFLKNKVFWIAQPHPYVPAI
jgi:hypothetical protein